MSNDRMTKMGHVPAESPFIRILSFGFPWSLVGHWWVIGHSLGVRKIPAMTADELISLNEQIAGMARAGLPLDQGLASLASEMSRGRLRRVTEGIVRDLKEGKTLPEAVAHRRNELPVYYA